MRRALPYLAIVLALGVLIAAQGPAWAQAPAAGQEPLATVTYAAGEVTIARAGAPAGQAVAVSTGVEEPLFAGDVVRTGLAGRAEVTLRDGSVVTLVEEAEFAVSEVVFEPAAGRRSATVKLLRGMARFAVKPVEGAGPESRFTVETPTAVVGVRGSESVVQAPIPGTPQTILWVLASLWQAQNADPSIPKLVDVPPEFFTEIFKGMPPTDPKPIPPEVLRWLRELTTLLKKMAMNQDSGPPLPPYLRLIPPGWPSGLQTVLDEKSRQQTTPTTPHKSFLQFGPPYQQDPGQIPQVPSPTTQPPIDCIEFKCFLGGE